MLTKASSIYIVIVLMRGREDNRWTALPAVRLILMADSTPSHEQQRVVLLSKAARARVLHGVNLSDLSHPYTV
jgi:hypothetical protein